MKKVLVVLFFVIGITGGIAQLAYAAVGDLAITIIIPAAKVDEFKTGFLDKHPVPLEIDENDPNGIWIPRYTDKQWLKLWMKKQMTKAYLQGKQKILNESVIIDPNIIE